MINEFIKAASLVFIAEMGDKTQIIAMTFATQYLVRHVLSGVALGVLANHGLAIILGAFIGNIITGEIINLVAGGLFVLFGWNALRIGHDEEVERKNQFHPILAVAMAFFIGELGDKTQLTAMALSAESEFPAIILMGTTLGMIGTSGLGIFVGSRIGDKVPETGLKIASSIVFIGFGVAKITNGLNYYFDNSFYMVGILGIIAAIEVYLMRKALIVSRTEPEKLLVKRAAGKLYEMTRRTNDIIDNVCLGEDQCGTCAGSACLIGYIKSILQKAREDQEFYPESDVVLENLLIRNYDKKKVEEALLFTIQELIDYGWTDKSDFVMTKTRESLEILIFDEKINRTGSIESYLDEIKKLNCHLGERYIKVLLGEAADEKKNN
ncbi:MAG: TMEM165/GDT1 family protein [Bacillota bacterium]